MKQERIVPVSSLVLRIKTILQQSLNLESIWIQGEVSNLTKHRSGHYYFSLKDETSELSCVMFSTYVRRLNFSLEEGMSILVQGSVSVYEQRGTLQFYVKEMKQDGIGNLYLEFEQRKERLLKAGYFDSQHKKEKPEWIENIAIVTAKEAAALQDVVKTIRMRWPAMKMTLYPAYVQGMHAPSTLIKALKKADANEHDAILLVRGGGSFEDLFCFNDEQLVKTIYSLHTYIVTGVGHEVDTTLVDLVSDHRAVTPTAAAQWVSLNYKDVLSKIKGAEWQITSRMNSILDGNKARLQSYLTYPYFIDPHQYVFEKTLKLDHYSQVFEEFSNITGRYQDKIELLKNQMNHSMAAKINQNSIKLESIDLSKSLFSYLDKQKYSFYKNVSLLDAYSPLKTLNRGYAIIDKNNKIIRTIEDVKINDSIHIRLKDGMIEANVQKKESNHG